MEFNIENAERALREASESNPGTWTNHSRYVAEACRNIAEKCSTIRYGFHPATIDRWKKTLEIKDSFEKEIGCSIYALLPGVVENSF